MDIIPENLYDRQKEIVDDCSDESAMVIGIGGIGSWIALDLALIGMGTIILIDSDTVELTNLNRTLFRLSDVGKYKTEALKDLITERRNDSIIITINEHFDPVHLEKYRTKYIFDCTDTLKVRQRIKDMIQEDAEIQYIKCGYDGLDCSVCFNDFESGAWGEESSYTIVPSFFGTPQAISALTITEVLVDCYNKLPARTVHFNLKSLLNDTKEVVNDEQ